MFRKALLEMLLHKPMSVTELARLLQESPAQIEHDLQHLLRSLKRSRYHAAIVAARCRKCDFVFHRSKLRKPGKCPRCHGTWIEEPRIGVEILS
jgi:predicted Zn-ribbon and HTH transcriptional regulator